MFQFIKQWKRKRYKRVQLSDDEVSTLFSVAPLTATLPSSYREKFLETVIILLHEKKFEGCGGLEINDTVRYVIASHASLLLLGEVSDYYPDLYTILVYPTAYMAPVNDLEEGGIVVEGREMRFGESWGQGSLVLAWDEISTDARRPQSGRNLVIHEFAHEIDQEFALTDEPTLQKFPEWGDTLKRSYHQHAEYVEKGYPTLLDPYGAENPAEFFAVSTEMFFGRPGEFKNNHPQLYHEISRIYNLDPADWKTTKVVG